MALRGEGSGPTWTSLFVFFVLLLGFRWSFVAVNGNDTNVQPLLYFTEEPSGTVYGAHFSTLCINCSASCTVSGAVNMTWRKDDRAIVDNSQGYSISNDSLCIEHFSKSIHEGFYECIAQHQIGTLVGSKVKVEEAGISSLYVDPVNISASVGESMRFQCVVNATPWPDIDWLKNDQKLVDNDSRVTVLKSGVLQLVNVTKDDEGQYKCLARNSWANETSLWATLSIVSSDSTNRSAAEVLLGRPQDQVVIVSQTVVLECFLGGSPVFPITWTKQGSEIRKDVRLFGSGNLEISDVNEADSGTYICGWTNSHDGENKTAQANITVYAPPRLNQSQSMRPYTLKRREQVVRLRCLFSGHPVPLVTWLKDGKIVKTNNRIRVDQLELSIIHTRASDEGVYQCRAENPAGMQQTATQLQYEINVNAPYPPVGLVASSVDSTSVQLSWRDSPQNRDRAVQAFSVHVIPPAGLEIQQVVPCKRKPCSESMLWKVEVLQPYTNYTIYVVAYTRQGRSRQSRKLAFTTAEDVPTRFPSLTLFALNSTSIRLSWKELSPDQANGVITEYMVKYQKHGASNPRQIPVRPPLTEYTLTGLDPSTKYNVLVAARTKVGYPLTSSDSLPWKTVITDGFYQSDVIPTIPQMTVAVIDNTALLVNWTRNTRIQILGYNLFFRSNGSANRAQMEFHVTLNKDVSRYLIKDLEPSTVYRVQLVAFNGNGDSVPVTQTVLTGSTVGVQVINSTAVILRWKRPSQTVIYEYSVRYCSLTSPVVNKSVTSFTESQIISELFPFTAYEFSVEARGSQMIRLGTAKCQTSEGVPSAPLDLDVSPLGRGSALIHWSPPVKQNGVITKYIVLYTTDHDWTNAYWFSQVENGTSLSTVVENLKPGVMYYFRVQAVTNAGRGPSSEIAHMSASVADTQALSDQELGIIIGTAIGVTCIIICTCVIVLHNRCRSRAVAAPIVSPEGRMTNGSVAHCHCQPSNYTAEFHVLHSRADDLSLFDNSHQLIENSNCDSKGGNMQNRRNLRYADQNNALPLLRGKSERVCNSLDLDGIDYDNDPIVTLNNAINCAGSDKIKDCDSENDIDKIASTDTVLCQNSLLGGLLPSQNCDHTADEPAKDEKEATGSGKDSDCETSSQNSNFDGDRIRV